ncbi:MAG: NosD domain-containing protein, partial [Candidatus Hodarchaeota archaeon]
MKTKFPKPTIAKVLILLLFAIGAIQIPPFTHHRPQGEPLAPFVNPLRSATRVPPFRHFLSPLSRQYTDHAHISIDGNDNFRATAAAEGWPGNGTKANPYIISNFSFTRTFPRPASIRIENTDVYFQIHNCYISATVGIDLSDVRNAQISNNTIRNLQTWAAFIGIGIALSSSINITIFGNTLSNNSGMGIHLENSSYTSIYQNKIISNEHYGIAVSRWLPTKSTDCIISNNTIAYNREGITLGTPSDNITVKWNDFLGNNPRGTPQASDHGINNVFTHNYWAEWTQPDNNGDGIVDSPYSIKGSASNQDSFPLVVPTSNLDSDSDGIPSWYEILIGLDSTSDDSAGDLDQDGLSNLEEYQRNTKADDSDTDEDGLSDGAEVNEYYTDPLVPDTDEDGLSDGAEVNEYYTDPLVPDTDEDGLSDGAEVNKHHSDPTDSDTDGDFFPDGLDHGRWGNPRVIWDNLLTRGLLVNVLLGLAAFVGLIVYQRSLLQQDLENRLRELHRQKLQLQQSIQENLKALNAVESLQELGEISKKLYQQFLACKHAIQAKRSHIARWRFPSFFHPDITSLEAFTASVNQCYTQFTQEYLKRVEELMD